jgi:hypothetical protein
METNYDSCYDKSILILAFHFAKALLCSSLITFINYFGSKINA